MESEQDIRERANQLKAEYPSINAPIARLNELVHKINRVNADNRHFWINAYSVGDKIGIYIHSKHHPDWKGSKP
jgi:hypothetical protein